MLRSLGLLASIALAFLVMGIGSAMAAHYIMIVDCTNPEQQSETRPFDWFKAYNYNDSIRMVYASEMGYQYGDHHQLHCDGGPHHFCQVEFKGHITHVYDNMTYYSATVTKPILDESCTQRPPS